MISSFPFFLNHSQRQPPTQPLSDTSLRHLSKAASRYRINWISEKVSPEKTGFGFDFPKQICISWSKHLTSTIRNFSDVGELFRFCCFCIGRCRCRLSPVIKFLRTWALVETQEVEIRKLFQRTWVRNYQRAGIKNLIRGSWALLYEILGSSHRICWNQSIFSRLAI